MELTWTKTDKGYAATGAANAYAINRTPGHRFALYVDGAEVKQGKLADLKADAARNEASAAPADRPAKPKPKPKLRTHKPATTTIPAAVIHREHVAAVEATTPDAYPPRKVVTAEAAGPVPDYVPTPRVGVYDGVPGSAPNDGIGIDRVAEIRAEWKDAGRTPDDLAAEFGGMLGVDPPAAPAPVPVADPDDDGDRDDDTPLAPPDPRPDAGDPVGFRSAAYPRFNVIGAATMRTKSARSPFPNAVLLPLLRPAAPIVGQDGRPIRSWLGGVIR